MKPISQQLKDARSRMKMSQKEFSKYLGINFSSYMNFEQGRYEPSGRNFMKIADKIVLK